MENMTPEQIEDLKKKAHAFDSEQGRLKKAQEDLEASKAQYAALAEKPAHIEAQQPNGDLTLDSKAREVFGEDGIGILSSMLKPLVTRLDDVGKKLTARDEQETKVNEMRKYRTALEAKLSDVNLPGFTHRIYGGDLSTLWDKFVESRPSIKRAQDEGDVETISDIVSLFIHQNKETVAGGGFSPSPETGRMPVIKADYTERDYQADRNELQRKLDNVIITEAEYNKGLVTIYDKYVTAQEKAEKAASSFGLV